MTKPPNRDARLAVLIRRWMTAADMSQNQLAAKLDTTQSIVSKWCNGKACPSGQSLLRILDATGHKIVR